MRCHPVLGLLAASLVAIPVFAQSTGKSEQRFPDVVSVKAQARGQDTFDFDVTRHSCRPDIFQLIVHEAPTPAVVTKTGE